MGLGVCAGLGCVGHYAGWIFCLDGVSGTSWTRTDVRASASLLTLPIDNHTFASFPRTAASGWGNFVL